MEPEGRIIKFRAWDFTHRRMNYNVVPYSFGAFSLQFAVTMSGNAAHAKAYAEPNHSPVMQFTGLFDKHVNEIYEGDILSYEDKKGVVEYINGGFWVKEGDRNFMPSEPFREVIGNIYENPKLLE